MASTILTENEKACCTLLADLFLDAELTSSDFDRISKRLHEIGMPLKEAYHLVYYELFPILCWNLISPFNSEALLFDPNWVRAKVAQRRASPRWMNSAIQMMEWACFSSTIAPQWKKIDVRYD